MLLKDYYKTLEVHPAATEREIKKSFRRLAQQFHPDKNPGDAKANMQFHEIREAYEILSDPQQRKEYNYKRWYNRSRNQSFKEAPLTPETILFSIQQLTDYIAAANTYQVDYDALSQYIRFLLNNDNIALLQQADDGNINRSVIQLSIQSAAPLPLRYIQPIADLLLQLADDNHEMNESVRIFIKEHQQKKYWDKYRIPVVIIITAVLCWLIYRFSR